MRTHTPIPCPLKTLPTSFQFSLPFRARFYPSFGVDREIGILLPNNQRQHRILRIQDDVLPYALC